MTIDNVTLICNGEIYNYKELFNEMNIQPTTNSDCEVILHLYIHYGIKQTLMLLDGYFSFIIYDFRTSKSEPQLVVARDPFGVRPLYILDNSCILDTPGDDNIQNKDYYSTSENIIAFASELKMLSPLLNSKNGFLMYYEKVFHIQNK